MDFKKKCEKFERYEKVKTFLGFYTMLSVLFFLALALIALQILVTFEMSLGWLMLPFMLMIFFGFVGGIIWSQGLADAVNKIIKDQNNLELLLLAKEIEEKYPEQFK